MVGATMTGSKLTNESAEALPPLSALVASKHDPKENTYREMERVAKKRGYEISHAYLTTLARGETKKAPLDPQVHAIAAAIDEPYEVVRAAMMQQFWGFVPEELAKVATSSVGAWVPPDLTPEERNELRRLVTAWVAARRHDDH